MRKVYLCVGWAAIAGAMVNPAGAGEIRGKIVISHALTKSRVSIPNYQIRGPSTPLPPAGVSSGGELERIAIFLESPIAVAPAPAFASVVQKNQRFDPRLVILLVGSTVSFPNSDPIFHNVFSLSPAGEFDLGYYPAGETREVVFDQPGIVQVYCHLHADMSAAIVVVPTPWYAKPDASGDFAFLDLPAGGYRVIVWHRAAGFFRRIVELSDHGTVELTFEIPLLEAP